MSRTQFTTAAATAARLATAVAAGIIATSIPAIANQDCAKDVAAAFEKQRTGVGYQVVTRQPGPQGEIVNTFLFVAPDKMHNTVVVPGQPAPLETIAIGRWAWANQGGGFQELYPQFAQSVTSDVAATLGQPAKVGQSFTCAGKVTRDGAEFVAYMTTASLADPSKPAGPDNPMLARTVLVDAVTGLPAFNLVGEPASAGSSSTAPLMASTYSYPANPKIEAPDAVPASRR
ncbi:MAG: hypothetical protein SH859_00455 [Hyphomicrobium aestuarii]|nr:hypothetical protein [Hyphomicrobium aestuarii]